MKKILLSIIAVAIAHTSFAQWTTSGTNIYNANSGYVGIGTANPQYNLEINAETPFLRLRSSVYTANPSILTIKGGVIFNQENMDKTAAILEAVPPGYHVPGILFATKTAWDIPGPGYMDWYHRMYIHPNGNVGIGTTNPDSKLAVNGTIHSTAVRVDLTGFADYVFKPRYILPSLTSVKAFIDKNQHLPEIPSEKEVIENGLDLGEMNKLLVKKVEELTLYAIESERKNEAQQKKLLGQEKRIKALESKLNILLSKSK
jgi:hypothetical protein